MSEMRILSLWQPWATLIALGLKQYETRSWGTDYRGKLAIHAAKRPIDGEGLQVIDQAFQLTRLRFPKMCLLESYPLGAIVAIAGLADCRQMISEKTTLTNFCQQPESIQAQQIPIVSLAGATELEQAVGDWQPGRFAWQLKTVRPLDEPLPFKGGQGLRWLDDAPTLLAIAAQLGDVVRRGDQ